jgi:hypothetical protein
MERMLERLMAKWDVTQHKMDAKIDKLGDGQEETKTAMNSLRSELEETIKTQMESALACVNQETQGLREELVKITETQRHVQVSIDT